MLTHNAWKQEKMMCTLLLQESNILKWIHFLYLLLHLLFSIFFSCFFFCFETRVLPFRNDNTKDFQEFEYNRRFTFTGEKAKMLMDINLHKPTTWRLEALCEVASPTMAKIGASALEQFGVSRYLHRCYQNILQRHRDISGTFYLTVKKKDNFLIIPYNQDNIIILIIFVRLTLSHLSIHFEWNSCEHGKTRSDCRASKSHMQTTQFVWSLWCVSALNL